MESLLTGQLGAFAKQRTAPLILELDLTEGVLETRPADPLSVLMTRHQPSITDIVAGLRKAADDQRVRALVAKVGGKPIGLGMVQELREAVMRFAAAGKHTVAWAESFGEFSPGNVPYYLATAFETIFLQPSGDLGLTGLAMERVFLRGALDKLGVTMEVGARHEYKSAAEQFTERGFSGPAREAVERMAESIISQLTAAVAERRHISPDKAAALVSRGPYLAEQALEAGLVDALGYRDEVYAAVRRQARNGAEPVLLYLGKYQRGRDLTKKAKQLTASRPDAVALIRATGMIRLGRGGRSPFGGSAIGSDSLTAALRTATADPHVKAIVLRVNSPGGSYTASDAIWREVVRTRNAGKPVVVSMSDVAASGGYYISMAADAIVAQPGTVTGSIGVITAKPVLTEMLGKAGVTTDSVVLGDHAAMFSTSRPFSAEDWEIVDRWLDHIYADFTGKVATGRGLTAQRVHEIARGRVWTGADAQEHGLVDELGGVHDAARIARTRAGLPTTAPLVQYPRLGPLDRLRPASNSEDRRTAVAARVLPFTVPATALPFAAAATRLSLAFAGTGPLALSHDSQLADGPMAVAAAAGAGLLAENWGPVWRLAALGGLPAAGPLLLPGSWTFE